MSEGETQPEVLGLRAQTVRSEDRGAEEES